MPSHRQAELSTWSQGRVATGHSLSSWKKSPIVDAFWKYPWKESSRWKLSHSRVYLVIQVEAGWNFPYFLTFKNVLTYMRSKTVDWERELERESFHLLVYSQMATAEGLSQAHANSQDLPQISHVDSENSEERNWDLNQVGEIYPQWLFPVWFDFSPSIVFSDRPWNQHFSPLLLKTGVGPENICCQFLIIEG